MRVKITAESSCDIPPEIAAKRGLEIFPLTIHKGGEGFLDGVTITSQEIIDHVYAGGELCATAAVSPATFAERFRVFSSEYDSVVHISIGAGFSACHQNAVLGAEGLDNVYIVDSRNLSSGQGLLVLAALDMADAGIAGPEIAEKLKELTDKIECSFVLGRLDFMRKGGRCSSVAALGANLLNLKPCIAVTDGKMAVVRKYRGSYEKCVCDYAQERFEGRNGIDCRRVFITRTKGPEGAMQAAREAVKNFGRFEEVIEAVAGGTVTCHCGDSCLGILFMKK